MIPVLLLHVLSSAWACTMITIGPQATKDGSALAIHTDDAGWGAADYRLVTVPASDHPPGAKRAIYAYAQGYPRLVARNRGRAYAPKVGASNLTVPLGYIDEVPHTHVVDHKNAKNAQINCFLFASDRTAAARL